MFDKTLVYKFAEFKQGYRVKYNHTRKGTNVLELNLPVFQQGHQLEVQ